MTKQPECPADSDRQAGALVTFEMLEAGAEALARFGPAMRAGDQSQIAELLKSVYRAMNASASRGPSSRSKRVLRPLLRS